MTATDTYVPIRLYPCSRFSAAKHSKGNSLRRQNEFIAKILEKHNASLDDSLSLLDPGTLTRSAAPRSDRAARLSTPDNSRRRCQRPR